MRRFTWILLSQNAQVIGVDATTLTVGFKTAGARDSFIGGGSEEILRQAAIDMIGADWKIETAVDPSAQPGAESAPRVSRPAVRLGAASPERATGVGERRGARQPAQAPSPRRRPESIAAARSNIAPTRNGDEPAPTTAAGPIPTPTPTATTRPPRTTVSTAPSCSSVSSARL